MTDDDRHPEPVKGPVAALVALALIIVVVLLAWLYGGDVPPTTTVTPTTPPTLTSLPTLPPTSTTVPPTTLPPTTTTTAAPTTTTTPPEAVNCRQEGRPYFEIRVGSVDEEGLWWTAPYCRTLPYSDAYWTDGDREGYRCAVMFLVRGNDPETAEVLGRVVFARIPGAAYGAVSDLRMDEGVRWYDGTLANDGRELGDCPDPTIPYEPVADVTDQRPTIMFEGDTVLEVRDYKRTVVPEHVRFSQAVVVDEPFTDKGVRSAEHQVYSRVAVVAYSQIDGPWVPSVAIYYDALAPGVEITTDLDTGPVVVPTTTTAAPVAAPPATQAPAPTRAPDAPSEVERWRDLVAAHFPAAQVDKALRVMHCESRGNPRAYNKSTAAGLMQVHHASWGDHFGVSVEDLFDPGTNLRIARKVWDIQGWGAWSCA